MMMMMKLCLGFNLIFEGGKLQSQMVSNLLEMTPHHLRYLIKKDDDGDDDDEEILRDILAKRIGPISHKA